MATRHLSLKYSIFLLLSTGCDAGDPDRTLRVIGEAVPPLQALSEISERFESETGIAVEVEQYEFETAVEKATLDLTAGTGHYDVVLQPHLSLGKFVTSGLLTPIDGLVPDIIKTEPGISLFQAFWKELSWFDGTVYGYPFTANTMYMAYREDLISDPDAQRRFAERYGYALDVPKTWKAYFDVAEFFTDPENNFYGTSLQGKRHPALWYEWLNFAYSFAGGVFDKKSASAYGPIVLTCPETLEATRFYSSLRKFSPPGTLEYTWDDQLAAMQQGRVFMSIMWSDVMASLEFESSSRVRGKMSYAPIPSGRAGGVSQIAGWSYLIPKTSKNADEALQFITWMLEVQNQVAQQLGGGSSALRQTYSDPAVSALPFTQAFVESVERARHMSDSFPEATRVSDILQRWLSAILSESVSVEEGLLQAAVEIDGAIADPAVTIRCDPRV